MVVGVLVASAVLTAGLAAVLVRAWGPSLPAHLLWAVAVPQIAASPVMVLRRRAPVAVAAVMAAVAIAGRLVMLSAPDALIELQLSAELWTPSAMTVAIHAMALSDAPSGRRRPVWALVAVLTLVAARPWAPDQGIAANAVLHTAVPALLGLYLGARRRLLRALTERAERAEAERLLYAEQARQQERVRLAEEMHDLVTHRVNLMVLQAGALEVTASEEATRKAAEQVRGIGCQALDELRDLVSVLRAPRREALHDVVPEVPELVAASRAAGVAATLVREGQGVTSPLVELTVRQIVRETLTNAAKHAPGAPVEVRVRHGRTRLEVTVRNPAPSGQAVTGVPATLAAAGSGSGLRGLRRRVTLMGGTLTAGRTSEGGFEVHADLPADLSAQEHPADPPAPEDPGRPSAREDSRDES